MGKQQRQESTDLSVRQERAILVGVDLRDADHDARESLDELNALAESAGAIVVDRMIQKRDRVDSTSFIGKGKVEELATSRRFRDADVIIFDDDLSPAQLREVEAICECKVIDRSELILDIFAGRARTHEARLQVELAQLEYTAPRLRGMWTHLERIAGAGGGTGVGAVGGIGTRGPGERQIEIDRRLVDRRVTQLKRQIAEIDKRKVRQVQSRHEHFNISLVGYTNAGKSTLMNTLTDAGVLVANRLFATLDTKTQRWNLGDGVYALLSDTVGFVRRLPHHLVASFRATLEEAIHADLLLHVVDASSPTAIQQYEAVKHVLEELGCGHNKTLALLNKIDAIIDPAALSVLRHQLPDGISISAKSGVGLDRLVGQVRELIAGEIVNTTLRLPSGDGKAVSAVEQFGQVRDRRYVDGLVEMDITIGSRTLNRLREQFDTITVVGSGIV